VKVILPYSQFITQLNEADGFGTLPFLFKKDGDLCYYFFQIDKEKGGQQGYVFLIGKYSRFENMEGPKNSYAVINLNQIEPEVIEDIAIENTKNLPEANSNKFKLKGGELARLYKQIGKCLLNYLEKNPKTIRIVDEMNQNLVLNNYEEYTRSMLISILGDEWHLQPGSRKGVYVLNR
jgi:hypothetical protein